MTHGYSTNVKPCTRPPEDSLYSTILIPWRIHEPNVHKICNIVKYGTLAKGLGEEVIKKPAAETSMYSQQALEGKNVLRRREETLTGQNYRQVGALASWVQPSSYGPGRPPPPGFGSPPWGKGPEGDTCPAAGRAGRRGSNARRSWRLCSGSCQKWSACKPGRLNYLLMHSQVALSVRATQLVASSARRIHANCKCARINHQPASLTSARPDAAIEIIIYGFKALFWRKLREETVWAVLIYSPEIAPCNRLGWLRKTCSPTGGDGNAHSARLLTGYEFISKEEPCFSSSKGRKLGRFLFLWVHRSPHLSEPTGSVSC